MTQASSHIVGQGTKGGPALLPESAIHSPAFPCNPRPFARRIDELCRADSGAIRGPACQACLWVLMGQSFGQMATIDLCDLWTKLVAEIPDPEAGAP